MKRRLLTLLKTADSGFTLLELLVVIIIVGIFAAIAAPGWTRYVANRRAEAVQTELKQLMEEAQTRSRTTRSTQTIEIVATGEDEMPTVNLNDVEREIATNEVRPGMVTLAADVANSDATVVSFDYEGAVEEPFVVEISAQFSGQTRCIAAISLIGGLVSGSGDECEDFKQEIGLVAAEED